MTQFDDFENENIPPITLDYADSTFGYDLVPYIGRSYGNTHPEHLHCLGRLRGINTVPMEKMRVLEIGCSTGGNILPIAMRYPKAEFVGIDPAEKEIDIAKDATKQLGVKNAEFHAIPAEQIDAKFGKFDYIICHGVFSWIPDVARIAIMKTCQDHLSENGLAVISYNCKPGWNFLNTVFELSLFHTRNIRDPHLSIQQSRQAIHFIADNAIGNSSYTEYFKNHADQLGDRADHYIFHEHLSPDNRALYFREFMDTAKDHNLNYVCETNDSYSDDLSYFKPDARKFLMTVNDRVERDQYIDYLISRQFRSTVLCLQDCKPDQATKEEAYTNLYFRPTYQLEEKEEEGKKMLHAKGRSFGFNVNNKNMEAVLRSLRTSEETGLNLKEWADAAKNYLTDTDLADDGWENFILSQMQVLINKGFVRCWPVKPEAVNRIEDKPKVFSYVKDFSRDEDANSASNYFGDSLGTLSKQVRLILPLLDGNHSLDDLAKTVQDAILEGELLLPNDLMAKLLGQFQEGQEVPRYSRLEKISVVQRMDKVQLLDIAKQVLNMSLQSLRSQSLLVR